ncbi:MAG: D-tyrosyl-tRNA(Tyr) deacylase [Alteromonadaceae bacterium]|nr:MAG: D-tyrosyl-tRNA(Tyr) deacylase [Alteromonadaceae bacterium]
MKALIQRVVHAEVVVNDECIGKIDSGILLLVGIDKGDDEAVVQRMADKVLAYRIFSDDEDKMNLSVRDINGGVLAISQFTLAANTKKGLRPSFSSAAPPAEAETTYNSFVAALKTRHSHIETGRFAADMKVSLLNDGPVTFLLEM